jgi:hypothetical protein
MLAKFRSKACSLGFNVLKNRASVSESTSTVRVFAVMGGYGTDYRCVILIIVL